MSVLLSVLDVLQPLVFVGLGLAALLHWRRRGGRAGGWLAASFAVLGVIAVLAALLPEGEPTALVDAVRRVELALFPFYPYLLLRFVGSFRPGPVWGLRSAAVVTVVLAGWALVLPDASAVEGERGPVFAAFLLALLVQWSVLSVLVASRLWRIGRDERPMARARMRTLAAGTIGLAVTLLLAGAVDERTDALHAVVDLLATGSALLLLAGYTTPPPLRALWRRRSGSTLREAQLRVVAAIGAGDMRRALLHAVTDAIGGTGSALVAHDGRVLASDGLAEVEARALAADAASGLVEDAVWAELRSGWLVVPTSAVSPFSGEEEVAMLQSLGSFVDLALERDEMFERERQARQELAKATAELEGIVYGLSHDLKTPLISLLGYLQLLREEHSQRLDDEGRGFVERMVASANYMQQLLSDLLELSRVGRTQTEPAPVDLGQVVAAVAAELGRAAPAARIEAGQLPVVLMNPLRARQLLTNLVENAIRHGGRQDVTVRVGAVPHADGTIIVRVADDGCGIPSAQREKAFAIFERLDERREITAGTGIGLAMCRRIVEDVGGTITVADTDRGTTIEVVVPASAVVTPAPRLSMEPSA